MNWLSAAVMVFLGCMIAYGAKKGLVRMIMSFAAVILSLMIVSAVYEPLETVVREQTAVYGVIESGVGDFVRRGLGAAADTASAGAQELIDRLMLPGILKTSLKEGNTAENYRRLGVSGTAEYITKWFADLVFSALVYVGAFLLVRIGLWILTIVLDTVMHLPVLRQINRLAGAGVGLAVAIALLWVGGLIVTAGAGTPWGQESLRMIGESHLLSMIYNNNYLISGVLMR